MNPKTKVLLVEDQAGSVRPLLDLLESRGYETVLETNEEAARVRLDEVSDEQASYALAIFDVMVAVKDYFGIVELDDSFYEKSRDAGIRLCDYARVKLEIPAETLPIVCISARDDEEVNKDLKERDIRLFNRTPPTPEESLRQYIKENLRVIDNSGVAED